MTQTSSDLTLPNEALRLLTELLPHNADPARPTSTLATVDADGSPDIRTVLLTSFTEEGLAFNTDTQSRKVTQLAHDPSAALCILLRDATRQIVAKGTVRLQSAEELSTAYANRSRYLQQLAWLNTPEFAVLPADRRDAEWSAFSAAHPDELTPSPTWTGYVLRPKRLTFWTAGHETASSRVEFTASADGWTRTVLPG